MAKKKRTTQEPAAEARVLTGLQEAELIEYVNWSDGDAGLRSCMATIVKRLEYGAFVQTEVHDPTDGLISRLDQIRRHRIIHRAMGSIGKHEKVLRNAYTIAPKPPSVSRFFGHWYSGIVLSRSGGVQKLAEACYIVSIEGKEKHPNEWRLIAKEQASAMVAYDKACAAYIAALKLAKQPIVEFGRRAKRETLPHTCRVSTVYPCPCGQSSK